MKVGEFVRMLERDGWYRVRQSGSHAIYRHPTKPGLLSVPVHHGRDIPLGLLKRLLRDAGLQ